jgi:hypothetical protein
MNQGLNETERYAMDELNRLRQWYETASKPYMDMLVHERRVQVPDRFIVSFDQCPKHPRYVTKPFCPDCRLEEEAVRPEPTPRVSTVRKSPSSAWTEGFNAAMQWCKDVECWMFNGGHVAPLPPRPEAPANPYKADQE